MQTTQGLIISPDATVLIVQKCPECKGEVSLGIETWCAVCFHRYTQEEMANAGDIDRQPCGHKWSDLREEDVVCDECDGKGEQSYRISLKELAGIVRELAGIVREQE